MNIITTADIIQSIPWEKSWDELRSNDKADLMTLLKIGILNSATEPHIKSKYEFLQQIFEERGIVNITYYL